MDGPAPGRRVSLWARPLWLVGLACAAWTARALLVGPEFWLLLWNLFLAVLPWAASVWIASRKPSRLTFGLAFVVWLLFLPNAPYLVTDLAHLHARDGVPLAVDVLVFAAFALAGVGLWAVSMLLMEIEVRRRLGRWGATAMIVLVLPLSGWGVYLGRFQRWNSWDVVVRPRAVLGAVREALLTPGPWAFAAGFAFLLAALYVTIRPPAPGPAVSQRTDLDG